MVQFLRGMPALTSYVPRAEAPSGTAGGKLAKVDRVKWVILREPQTQVNALVKGEVDAIEVPAVESLRRASRQQGGGAARGFRPLRAVRASLQPSAAPVRQPADTDVELEKLRDAYAATDNGTERKALAEKTQVRAMETVAYVPLGELGSPPAVRREFKAFVPGYYFHAWNVEKVGP